VSLDAEEIDRVRGFVEHIATTTAFGGAAILATSAEFAKGGGGGSSSDVTKPTVVAATKPAKPPKQQSKVGPKDMLINNDLKSKLQLEIDRQHTLVEEIQNMHDTLDEKSVTDAAHVELEMLKSLLVDLQKELDGVMLDAIKARELLDLLQDSLNEAGLRVKVALQTQKEEWLKNNKDMKKFKKLIVSGGWAKNGTTLGKNQQWFPYLTFMETYQSDPLGLVSQFEKSLGITSIDELVKLFSRIDEKSYKTALDQPQPQGNLVIVLEQPRTWTSSIFGGEPPQKITITPLQHAQLNVASAILQVANDATMEAATPFFDNIYNSFYTQGSRELFDDQYAEMAFTRSKFVMENIKFNFENLQSKAMRVQQIAKVTARLSSLSSLFNTKIQPINLEVEKELRVPPEEGMMNEWGYGVFLDKEWQKQSEQIPSLNF